MIRIDNVLYLASRLAWVHTYGAWPQGDIDHDDQNTTSNKIGNLRLASHTENMFNRPVQKNSKTGTKGVGRHGNQWRARIRAFGKDYVECFPTQEEAMEWRMTKASELHGRFSGD